MELKFDKNRQLKVRLAIVESQLKLANNQKAPKFETKLQLMENIS